MASEPVDILEDAPQLLKTLMEELQDLYAYKNLFFENHPIEMASEKMNLIEKRQIELLKKIEAVDVDEQIPVEFRAQFSYMKGRCYNINSGYDPRATQCLSKAVKLNPHMVDAWNELGECYWKNLNIKEAKASFEGALKHERNRLSLRCLSIILRQEISGKSQADIKQALVKSVDLAKEAVALDTKDGVSWNILGNAYLCYFFAITQDPATLKLCISAYKQAWLDPIARGHPDLYYNMAVTMEYEEIYESAIENYTHACLLDPTWEPPKTKLNKLKQYLNRTDELVRTRGKLKSKKLTQMVQNMDRKMLGEYATDTLHTFGERRNVLLTQCQLDALEDGQNKGKVILGRVVGSIHNENSVPFTFAIVDENTECACVTVYNWADGRGTIIGDCVTIPEPATRMQRLDSEVVRYNFKSIRVNNPMMMLVNGKRIGRNQYASTRVSSTYQIH